MDTEEVVKWVRDKLAELEKVKSGLGKTSTSRRVVNAKMTVLIELLKEVHKRK